MQKVAAREIAGRADPEDEVSVAPGKSMARYPA
jgi:hypothetical protein